MQVAKIWTSALALMVNAASTANGSAFAELRSIILTTTVALSSCAGIHPGDVVLLIVLSHPISSRLALTSPN
ncbi:hypothetical protein GUJ93_ZPchr0003g17527 [Zizania palustris]|uniref:Secreted protein n=1 Tax=Zizania palustris TaxID=103762 RepID=A0A8J5RWW8_ZIZPA|nr:hypothetical protein GUJ93_ZPchr0003g17527 [Zizania palustris]